MKHVQPPAAACVIGGRKVRQCRPWALPGLRPFLLAVFIGVLFAATGLIAQSVQLQRGEITYSERPYPPTVTFHAQSVLVELAVVVRDRKGELVGDLKREDFTVYDREKPQAIALFSETRNTAPGAPGAIAHNPDRGGAAPRNRAAPAGRSVAVFLDDRHTDVFGLRYAARALDGYFDDDSSPADQFRLVTSSGRASGQFTSDRVALKHWLDKLRPATHDLGGGCPLITPQQAFLIVNEMDSDALQLAVSQALVCGCPRSQHGPSRAGQTSVPGCFDANDARHKADEVWSQAQLESQLTIESLSRLVADLGRQPGPRVLLLASNGFLSYGLEPELDRVVEQALRSGVVINALDTRGLTAPEASNRTDDPPLPQDPRLSTFRFTLGREQSEARKDAMAALSEATGGRLFTNNNDLTRGTRMLLSPEVVYHLAFTPDQLAADGGFHALKVRLDRPGLSVQTRSGYYAPKPSAEARLTPKEVLQREALNAAVREPSERPNAAQPIPLAVATAPGAGAASAISIAVHIGMSALPYARQAGRDVERLTLVSVLLEPDGRIVAGKEATIALRLRGSTRQHLPTLNASLTLSAPPGTYRLREVLQEAEQGRITSVERQVSVP